MAGPERNLEHILSGPRMTQVQAWKRDAVKEANIQSNQGTKLSMLNYTPTNLREWGKSRMAETEFGRKEPWLPVKKEALLSKKLLRYKTCANDLIFIIHQQAKINDKKQTSNAKKTWLIKTRIQNAYLANIRI